MRRIALIILLIIPGLLIASFCGYYALKDYAALHVAYEQYHRVVASNAGINELFAAYSRQDIHRINLFADGVWTLIGVLLAGIGLHGLCVMPRNL
ncbi:MAG: hypothetical protein PHT33_07995 [bacterium]|nr:hypothetical protein [bacterium]